MMWQMTQVSGDRQTKSLLPGAHKQQTRKQRERPAATAEPGDAGSDGTARDGLPEEGTFKPTAAWPEVSPLEPRGESPREETRRQQSSRAGRARWVGGPSGAWRLGLGHQKQGERGTGEVRQAGHAR